MHVGIMEGIYIQSVHNIAPAVYNNRQEMVTYLKEASNTVAGYFANASEQNQGDTFRRYKMQMENNPIDTDFKWSPS